MDTLNNQHAFLNLISQMDSAGRAEGESNDRFPRTFLPVAEHLRAFDPDVVLVVGPRGAGKTELFRAVVDQGILDRVVARVSSVRLPPLQKTDWISGYSSQGTGFPSEPQLRAFLQREPPSDDLFLDLWLAYLVRTLKNKLPSGPLDALQSPQGGDVAEVLKAYRQNVTPALLALDALDARLAEENRFVFMCYDGIETLARNDPHVTRRIVRGLVALWAGHSRRWQRLRGKIFLRTDLYEEARKAGGTDFVKLAANRVEITWSDLNLLAMLVRRLANSGKALRDYCSSKIEIEDAGDDLGAFPIIRKTDDARPLIERMVGIYMGAGIKKGLAFRWVLDHVRDGRGHALPRPLVRLFEAAAEIQKQQDAYPRWPRLLEPQSLRRALDRVSEEHVGSALDEWPWLAGLKDRLKELREVPWERREIDRHLDRRFDQSWGGGDVRPPADSGRDMVDYLVEVGVFRSRADGRIDAPDLFLAGLGLKRKGGVNILVMGR